MIHISIFLEKLPTPSFFITWHRFLIKAISIFVLMFSNVSYLPAQITNQDQSGRQWLAGDHHIHSRYSVGWNRETNPPTAIIGGDAIYATPMNAVMAKYYGLSWMVTTDHGGPLHSKINRDKAYPELLMSRKVVPDLIQFYGMELNTPGADHTSLIIPHTHDEVDRLYEIESQFDSNEPYPEDKSWNSEPHMLDALRVMNQFLAKPLIIANHPSRSNSAPGVYVRNHPAELRNWNDTAPKVAVGMAGAPGHQARSLQKVDSLDPDKQPIRGYKQGVRTMGGFDPMTARVGGFWDSMLGEGRRWWITANSDSHVHWTEGGKDFWPGEYSKTYVFARPDYDDILDGIRHGRIFVTLGDLISELQVTAGSAGNSAGIGGSLQVKSGNAAEVIIRFRDSEDLNAGGYNPSVKRVDIIVGQITGPAADRSIDTNPTTAVVARFYEKDWLTEGPYRVMAYRMQNITADSYLRLRGTNVTELEPAEDTAGEDPWSDLWFYSNPIFIEVE